MTAPTTRSLLIVVAAICCTFLVTGSTAHSNGVSDNTDSVSVFFSTQFSDETMYHMATDNHALHFLIFTDQSTDMIELEQEIRLVSRNHQKLMHFFLIDKEQGEKYWDEFGVQQGALPAGRLVSGGFHLRHYYFPRGKLLVANKIDAFIQDFLRGRLQPHWMDEVTPEEDKSPIVRVTHDNFEEVVLDQSKDVFVKFYAPWCRHSKEAEGELLELANVLSDADGVVVARMDWTYSQYDKDEPAVHISGFPTYHLWRAGRKGAPVVFNQQRTMRTMLQFIAQHASNDVSASDLDLGEEEDALPTVAPGVVEVDEDSLEDIVETSDIVVVTYDRDECAACTAMHYTLSHVATQQTKRPLVSFARYKLDYSKTLAQHHLAVPIRYMPQLAIFTLGHVEPYRGSNDERSVREWVEGKQRLCPLSVRTEQEMATVLQDHHVVVAAILRPSDTAIARMVRHVAYRTNNVSTAFVVAMDPTPELCRRYHVHPPALIMWNELHEGKDTFGGDLSTASMEDVEEFIADNAHRVIRPLDMASFEHTYHSRFRSVFIFLGGNKGQDLELVRQMTAIARDNSGSGKLTEDLHFFTVSADDLLLFGRLLSVTRNQLPCLRLTEGGEQPTLFKYPHSTMADYKVREWLRDHHSGLTTEHKRHPKVGKKRYRRAVRQVTGNSFEDIVWDETKDVLVKFYAPWDNNGKLMKDDYFHLGERLRPVRSLVIAEMNAEKHQHDSVHIQGFPTLLMFKANDKANPVTHWGGRTPTQLLEFVQEHASIPFEVPPLSSPAKQTEHDDPWHHDW